MRIKSLVKKMEIKAMNNGRYIKYLCSLGMKIGDECEIHKSANIGSEPYLIELGNRVRITKGVVFVTHDGGLWVPRNMGIIDSKATLFGKIKIGNNVNVGLNAVIMPGVTIGDNCVIGCNAVVTKNIPNNSVVAGVPAKVIESIEEYAEKNAPKSMPTYGMDSITKKEYILSHWGSNVHK